MIIIVHNTREDKQQSKLNYVYCGEVYLVDLIEEKIHKISVWTVQGLASIHDHIACSEILFNILMDYNR